VVSSEKLEVSSSVSRKKSSAAYFSDAGFTRKGPKRSVTEADDNIRIKAEKLLSESIEFGFILPPDVTGFEKCGEAGDARRFVAAVVEKIVPGWVGIEDVGAVDFGVEIPDRGDVCRVGFAVVGVDVFAVERRKLNDLCFG
jgi:hypothetical protein